MHNKLILFKNIDMKSLTKLHKYLFPKDKVIDYSAYINLVFLSLLFGNLYFRPVYGAELAIIIIGLLTFLVCYFRAYVAEQNKLSFYIIAISLLGVGISEINLGGNIMFVYAAAFCGNFENRKKAFLYLFLILAFTVFYSLFTDKSSYFWIPAIFMSLALGMLNINRAEVLHKNKALKQSQQETQQLAKIAERERISRDLHDLLGHSLSVITLKSELAGKMLEKSQPSEKIRAEIKAIEALSRETLAQVRDAVKGYNKATISGELLQAKVAMEASGIKLITNMPSIKIPLKIESELALILREAITNIIRHADTKKVWIELKLVEQKLSLAISDQGQFTLKKPSSGLQNMQSRIEFLGGSMEIINQPNTQLLFMIPINEETLP